MMPAIESAPNFFTEFMTFNYFILPMGSGRDIVRFPARFVIDANNAQLGEVLPLTWEPGPNADQS